MQKKTMFNLAMKYFPSLYSACNTLYLSHHLEASGGNPRCILHVQIESRTPVQNPLNIQFLYLMNRVWKVSTLQKYEDIGDGLIQGLFGLLF